MRKIIAGLMGLATPLVLAGCGGGADPAVEMAASRAGHASMVVGLGNNFIWDCTLEHEDPGGAPWQFVLQRRGEGPRAEVVALEAGKSVARRTQVRKDNAARIYLMHEGSRILIAADGEVRARGTGIASASDHPDGRCRKGGQPA